MDNFDVIKLMDGNFPIFVGIKVGDQKRMNLVEPSRLIPCPQVVRIQQILEGIPRGFGQERAEHLKDLMINRQIKKTNDKFENKIEK